MIEITRSIRFDEADMATASAQGFMDGATAPAQPVAAPATRQGGAYAALPVPNYPKSGGFPGTFAEAQMRAFADATHMLRASHGEAPAQHTRPCVVCGSDEPFTGTCGSGDPRALCKQPTSAQAADSGQEDAARWRMAALIGNELMMRPEKRTHATAVRAYMDATHSGSDLTAAVDAAIAAQRGSK